MAIETVNQSSSPLACDLNAVAELAKQKGYALHQCVPLTEGAKECWQIHRGFSLKFFATFDELAAHVREVEPWAPIGRFTAES